jgi:WD40 repeat protein
MLSELATTITSQTGAGHGGAPRPKPVIPDHEVVRCIGAGAYGEVWLARNVLGGYRAAKVVYRDSFRDEHAYEREFRGIQNYEPISRSNDGLLDILQAGRKDASGYYYYVMELADDAATPQTALQSEAASVDSEPTPAPAAAKPADAGGVASVAPLAGAQPFDPSTYVPLTLTTLTRSRGRLPAGECVQVGLQLSLALGHLHRHGLIHRDIKPSNIIFVQGIPKLADIGLVTPFDATCSFVGTEGFVPPEGPTSPRADLFSLGKVLYELSSGRDRKDFPEPPTELGERSEAREIEELNTIILKACAPDPAERYGSAAELHADLALVNSGKSVRWKHAVERRLAFARRAGAGVALLAMLATGGYLFQRHLTRQSETLLARIKVQNAEEMFQRGESSLALAHLAQVLREHPGHRVAAERILAAVTQRNFLRQATRPLQHPASLENRVNPGSARFSPDGRLVATAAEDQVVRLWNVAAATMVPLRHLSSINTLEFSPDGRALLTAAHDRTVWLWNTENGEAAVPALNHPARVDTAVFSSDGAWIATGCADGNARLFEAGSGRLVHSLEAFEDKSGSVAPPITSVVFSPDHQSLATASIDGTVRLWDVRSGLPRRRFRLDGEVRLLRFSPDGIWLAGIVAGSTQGWRIQVWDLRLEARPAEPLLHQQRIYSLAFSPDSQRLVTATGNNAAQVWEVATGRSLFRLPHAELVMSACFSPDGRQILTASADRTARLWDATTGAPLAEPLRHDGRVVHAEFRSGGEQILTASRDRTVKLWQNGRRRPSAHELPHSAWVLMADLDPAGERLITATGDGMFTATVVNTWRAASEERQHSVAVWNFVQGTKQFAPSLPRWAAPLAAQFTRLGPRALVAEERQSPHARIWDVEQGAAVGGEIQHATGIGAARFSSDGRRLATGAKDGTVRVWNARLGQLLSEPMLHRGQVNSVRFSPDDEILVTASSDGSAMLWAAATGRPLAQPLKHEDQVWFAQFSFTGDKLVTASRDTLAKVWHTNGHLVAVLPHSDPVEYAEFSPDGVRVVTASGDQKARVWDANRGTLVRELHHGSLVMTARFSPDGRRIATASKDGTAQLWDADTGLKLSEPLRHRDWVVSALFSGDGRWLVSISLDRTARVWQMPMLSGQVPSWLPELAEASGGQRLNQGGIAEVVPWDRYRELIVRLAAMGTPADPVLREVQRILTDSTEPFASGSASTPDDTPAR